jgi:hypothetical protein
MGEKTSAKVRLREHYPDQCSEGQSSTHILPCLSAAKRGVVCQNPLYQVFNYILSLLGNTARANASKVEERE